MAGSGERGSPCEPGDVSGRHRLLRPPSHPSGGAGDGQGGAAPPALSRSRKKGEIPSANPSRSCEWKRMDPPPSREADPGLSSLRILGVPALGPLCAPLPADTSQDTPAQGKPAGRCGEHGWKDRGTAPRRGTPLWLPPPPGLTKALVTPFRDIFPNKRHVCLRDRSGPKMPPNPRLLPHPKGQVLPFTGRWPSTITAQRSFGGISKSFLTTPSTLYTILLLFPVFFPLSPPPSRNKHK